MRPVSLSLFFAGVVGAAQTATAPAVFGTPEIKALFTPAFSILLTAPTGALLGVLIASGLLRILGSKPKFKTIVLAYSLSLMAGFYVSLLAPMLLAGLAPHPASAYINSFCIEYSLAWLFVIGLCFYESRVGAKQ